MPADLSTARNPLPSDQTPEAPSPAAAAAATVGLIQEMLRGHPKIDAILAAYHSRKDPD